MCPLPVQWGVRAIGAVAKGEARVTRWSKTAGGAVLGRQDALGGWWGGIAGRCARGRAYSLAPRCPPLRRGTGRASPPAPLHMVERGGFLLSWGWGLDSRWRENDAAVEWDCG